MTKLWSLSDSIQEAKKFKTRSEWAKNSSASYHASLRSNWLEECTKHMKQLRLPKGYWTKERCLIEAKKYKNISEWKKKSPSSYNISKKNNWVTITITVNFQ